MNGDHTIYKRRQLLVSRHRQLQRQKWLLTLSLLSALGLYFPKPRKPRGPSSQRSQPAALDRVVLRARVLTLPTIRPLLLETFCDYLSRYLAAFLLRCIFAEMATGRPLLTGTSESDQLARIFRQMGTPTPLMYPGLQELPDYRVRYRNAQTHS